MSLIPQEKLNKKIEDLIFEYGENGFTAIETKNMMRDLISWYNEQMVDELQEMKKEPFVVVTNESDWIEVKHKTINDIINRLTK